MTSWLKGKTPLPILSTPRLLFLTDGVLSTKPVRLAGLDYVAKESQQSMLGTSCFCSSLSKAITHRSCGFIQRARHVPCVSAGSEEREPGRSPLQPVSRARSALPHSILPLQIKAFPEDTASQESFCYRMQAWLPAPSKASTQEVGTDVKKSIFLQVLASWKMGDSHLKARRSISGILASLHRRARGRGDLSYFR